MALCVTRLPGQRLLFSRPNITITVKSVEGKSVRLVIDAPKHITITREELVYRAPPKSPEAAT